MSIKDTYYAALSTDARYQVFLNFKEITVELLDQVCKTCLI